MTSVPEVDDDFTEVKRVMGLRNKTPDENWEATELMYPGTRLNPDPEQNLFPKRPITCKK